MAAQGGAARFFRFERGNDDELNRYRIYLNIDIDDDKSVYSDPIRWEESIFNLTDGNYADRKAIATAPAIEVYKWFLLGAKRNQRREDQRAIMEYENQVNNFHPRN